MKKKKNGCQIPGRISNVDQEFILFQNTSKVLDGFIDCLQRQNENAFDICVFLENGECIIELLGRFVVLYSSPGYFSTPSSIRGFDLELLSTK
jgi:sRNA-binding regulator protein Hfq